VSVYKQFKVTLTFVGTLPQRSFTVYAIDAANAVQIAISDAKNFGYKIALMTGHEVEAL
jgi:hypothetical protein